MKMAENGTESSTNVYGTDRKHDVDRTALMLVVDSDKNMDNDIFDGDCRIYEGKDIDMDTTRWTSKTSSFTVILTLSLTAQPHATLSRKKITNSTTTQAT